MTHPYSIYIWQPPLSPRGEGHWTEALQAYTQEWALYVVGLIHQDRRSVIKVVRYGLNIQCYPDAPRWSWWKSRLPGSADIHASRSGHLGLNDDRASRYLPLRGV